MCCSGVARSGTTLWQGYSIMPRNGSCVVEPTPNLNVETRLMMEGRLDDPLGVISNTVIKRMHEHQEHKSCIYGEKNVTYAPFIQYIFHEIPCRFCLYTSRWPRCCAFNDQLAQFKIRICIENAARLRSQHNLYRRCC